MMLRNKWLLDRASGLERILFQYKVKIIGRVVVTVSRCRAIVYVVTAAAYVLFLFTGNVRLSWHLLRIVYR